ncbi:MAG TPA: hypothetical protein EYQ14_07350 [Gammaproteobacteria bacterium]|nr:hypothetical protein [Gammaproteobacteria bacterium]HIL95936.1 hypothetical protein [Pseudomonadales bacterium]
MIVHPGVGAPAEQVGLCRYIIRPAVSAKRLSMSRNGRVLYAQMLELV